jgi:hypothetical protein
MGVQDNFLRVVLCCEWMYDNRFWEYTWLGDNSSGLQYPNLYNIVRAKEVIVADVLPQTPLNTRFNRSLKGDKWGSCIGLVRRLMRANLNDEPHSFKWFLSTTCAFTVKSMHAYYMNGHTVFFLQKYLWNIKVPLDISIFMCLLYMKVLLTKDDLAKRWWNGCKNVSFVIHRRQ